MRTFHLELCLAGLIVANVATADEPKLPAVSDSELFARLDTSGDGLLIESEITANQRQLFDRLVRKADKNGDGNLTAEEFATGLEPTREAKPLTEEPESTAPGGNAARVLLLLMDSEPDGVIRRDEVPEKYRFAFDSFAGQVDYNKNKSLEPIELARGGPQVMRAAVRAAGRLRIDVDKELKRLKAEQGDLVNRFDEAPSREKMFASPERAKMMFAQLDADGNKKIEASEIPPQADGFERLFRTFDANRDKALSEEEFARAAERIGQFTSGGSAPSANQPTQVSEAKTATPQPTEQHRRVAAKLVEGIIKRLDKNGDNQLAADEITGKMADRVRQADIDGNGSIDSDEIETMKQYMAERLAAGGNGKKLLDRIRGK